MKLVIDMIYLNNNSDVQQVYIPRETLNIKKVSSISDDQLSDYYTKSEVDNLIDGVEVDLSDYYTKTEVDGLVDNIDLTGYATETWVEGKDYVQKTNLATVNGQTLYNGGDIVIKGGAEQECIVIQYVGDYTVKNTTQGTSTTYKYSGSDRQQHNLEMIQKILAGDTRAVYYQYLLEQVYRYDENGDYVNPPTWIVFPLTYRYPSHDGLARFMGVVEKNEYASPSGVYSLGLVLKESDASIYSNKEYKLEDYFSAEDIDLTGYATKDYVANTCYTKSEIDTMVGDINTLLASI